MKAAFPREALREAVTVLGGAVPSNDAKPVLQNMKIVAEASGCTLETTNMELGVRVQLKSVQTKEAGSALIPVSRLAAILREMTGEDCTIEADTQKAMVYAGFAEFEMPSDDVDKFPSVADFDADDGHWVMRAADVRLMINRTQFAAASENPRYAMNGVLWEFEKDQARLVATDGRRLSICRGKAVNAGGKDTDKVTHIVPRSAVGLLSKTLTDPDEELKVMLKPNEAIFSTPRATIYTRLVEGRYPAWREVVPKKSTTTIKVQASAIHAAVRQAAIMSDDESKAMEWAIKDNLMTLACKGGGTGRSKIELQVEKVGKDMKIRFDPQFLTAMFRVVDGETPLAISLQESSPGMIKAGDDYDYVVMPLG